MTNAAPLLTSWHECTECGFQGTFYFAHIEGEDYSDEYALGYLMLTNCPSCENSESLYISVEHYREMALLAAQHEDKD